MVCCLPIGCFRELSSLLRTYRDYVNDTGQDVAIEAGPNGPENVKTTVTSDI